MQIVKKQRKIGWKLSQQTKDNISRARLEKKKQFGYINSPETRAKMSRYWTGKKGKESNAFVHGTSSEENNLRTSKAYREWRKAVFERDDYTCLECGVRGQVMNADHIKPWGYFPELRYELTNGRTLCKSCHLDTDTFGHRARLKYEYGITSN